MSIKPFADRVLLEPVEEEKVTESGIYLPETSKEKPVMAKVVEVGPGKTNDEGKLIPLTVKQGDVVVFSKYAGTEVKVGDKTFLIVNETDILATVEIVARARLAVVIRVTYGRQITGSPPPAALRPGWLNPM